MISKRSYTIFAGENHIQLFNLLCDNLESHVFQSRENLIDDMETAGMDHETIIEYRLTLMIERTDDT